MMATQNNIDGQGEAELNPYTLMHGAAEVLFGIAEEIADRTVLAELLRETACELDGAHLLLTKAERARLDTLVRQAEAKREEESKAREERCGR